MTKRKKQIEIVGFTKASNLLPKDKKQDNKNTPSKTTTPEKKPSKDRNRIDTEQNYNDSNAHLSIDLDQSNDSIKTKNLNDTDFFNTTTEDTDSILSQDRQETQNRNTNDNQILNTSNDAPTNPNSSLVATTTEKTSETNTTTMLTTLYSSSKSNSPKKEKIFGTSSWCAARAFCTNKTSPATYDYWCTLCQYSGHLECVIIPQDADPAQCVCIYCQPPPSPTLTKTVDQSLMQTDTSIIVHEDSFDTWQINNEHDIQALNTMLDQTESMNIHTLVQVVIKKKDDVIFSDEILHALALSIGVDIEPKHLESDKLIHYIMRHQIWFTQEKNMELYFQSNFYKLLHKVIDPSISLKERSRNKKLYTTKLEILSDFIHLPKYKHKYLHNILQLSKVNGIFLPDHSLKHEGKQIIQEILCQPTSHKISQDDYSQDKLQRYINSNIPLSISSAANTSDSTTSRVTKISDITSSQILAPTLIKSETGSRFDIRIYLPEKNDLTTVRTELQRIVHQITEIDPTATFLPWFSSEASESMPYNVVPESLWEINKYFPRIKATKTGPTYGEFRMSHTKAYNQIIEEISPWLYENRHAIYYQALQSKLTTNLGWFLWSFRNIDTIALQQELYQLYNIQVHLRFQNIALNKSNKDMAETVKALHIIVNKDQAEKISTILQSIYSFSVEHFPIGIIMRFIPHISKVSVKKENTLSKLRTKQRLFTESIQDPSRPMMTRTWEIQSLDAELQDHTSLKKTLMEVKSIENDKEYLFLSIDISFFRKQETIFTFLPIHENEARSFVTNIIPFIRHKFPSANIEKVFLQEAIERNKDSIWNADTQEIVSQADIYLEQSSNIIENFNMIEALGIVIEDNKRSFPNTQAHEKVQKLFLGDDNTSIGTLFTSAPQEPNINSNTYHKQITPSTTTARSLGTTLTIDEVDNKLNLLSSNMQKIHQLLYTLLDTKGNQNEMDISKENINQKKVAGELSNSTCETPCGNDKRRWTLGNVLKRLIQ